MVPQQCRPESEVESLEEAPFADEAPASVEDSRPHVPAETGHQPGTRSGNGLGSLLEHLQHGDAMRSPRAR